MRGRPKYNRARHCASSNATPITVPNPAYRMSGLRSLVLGSSPKGWPTRRCLPNISSKPSRPFAPHLKPCSRGYIALLAC
eukprot:scaffold520709_cov23-Prasinocladus_malaysianus.AAC.1